MRKLGRAEEAIGALHAPAADIRDVLLEGAPDDSSMFYSGTEYGQQKYGSHLPIQAWLIRLPMLCCKLQAWP